DLSFKHNGGNLLFASQQNKNAFAKDPEKYIPPNCG
ncbi:MAG: YHS domain-containing protein, partial [Arenicella sp.]